MSTAEAGKPRSAGVAARCQQRREAILDAAVRLFARDGYADLDLQVLADEVGVGKGTLYRHFGSKERLFLAAADRVMRDLIHRCDVSTRGLADPLERIRRGVHTYLQYFHEHPAAVEMLIIERARFKDRKRPTYFEHRDANVERWRANYRELIDQGRVRADLTPEQISDVAGDLLYGTMFVNYIAGRRRPPAVMADGILDFLFHGILSDAERQARRADRPPAGL
jgi:AcrR family transcriptional regulator